MTKQYKKISDVVAWFLAIALALFFGLAGVTKLMGIARQVALFDAIGIGQWFRYVTGILESGAALLVLFPRSRVFGMLLLIALSIGAIITLILLGRPLLNGVFALAMSLTLAALRMPDFAANKEAPPRR